MGHRALFASVGCAVFATALVSLWPRCHAPVVSPRAGEAAVESDAGAREPVAPVTSQLPAASHDPGARTEVPIPPAPQAAHASPSQSIAFDAGWPWYYNG
jgi:hypothetical protein